MTRIALIEGNHVTAAEKRTIAACIRFQNDCAETGMPCPEYLAAKRSPKSYKIENVGGQDYRVTILTKETSDFGRKQTRKSNITVRVA